MSFENNSWGSPNGIHLCAGTTLLIGDTTHVTEIYAAIPGSKNAARTAGEGFFTVPCNSIPTDISLNVGGSKISMNAFSFNLGQVSAGSADCVGGLMADDSVGTPIVPIILRGSPPASHTYAPLPQVSGSWVTSSLRTLTPVRPSSSFLIVDESDLMLIAFT